MSSRVWLLGLILAVPLIGFAVSQGLQAHMDSQLRSALREEYPDAEGASIAAVTVDLLCAESPSELRSLCDMSATLNLMSTASIAAGAVGLLLLLVISVAGTASRNSRMLLLYTFRPGLYLTALVVVGLVITHAGIAVTALYLAESSLVGRVHIGIILAIALGALAGVAAITRSVFVVVRKAHTFVVGSRIDRQAAPELWRRVDQIAERLGSLKPENVVVGVDPTFFVTEATVTCLDGTLGGRTLYCSLPLCRIMTDGELAAVIGHELGHFKGRDTAFSERFYPVYRGTISSITSLQTAGGDGSGSVALLPAIAILSYFLECFAVAESGIGRQRELEADRAAASVTDRNTIAAALVKVHAFSGLWHGVERAAQDAVGRGNMFVNASKVFAEVVESNASPEALVGIADSHTPHPTDSHPPLGVRLSALEVAMEDVASDSLLIRPHPSAISLIPEAERWEEEVSGAFQGLMARQLGVGLETAQEGDAGSA